ncbi:MAG TPA: hypothetical protein VG844_07195 [Terracidiphilus sp.]|nr:hypothetical protein [Terracidiphilus sp.]
MSSQSVTAPFTYRCASCKGACVHCHIVVSLRTRTLSTRKRFCSVRCLWAWLQGRPG